MCLCKVIFTTAFWEPGNFSEKKKNKNAVLISFSTLHFCVLHIILRSTDKLHPSSIPQARRWSFLAEQPFTFRPNWRFPLLASQTGQNLTYEMMLRYEVILAFPKDVTSGFLRGQLFVSVCKKVAQHCYHFPNTEMSNTYHHWNPSELETALIPVLVATKDNFHRLTGSLPTTSVQDTCIKKGEN